MIARGASRSPRLRRAIGCSRLRASLAARTGVDPVAFAPCCAFRSLGSSAFDHLLCSLVEEGAESCPVAARPFNAQQRAPGTCVPRSRAGRGSHRRWQRPANRRRRRRSVLPLLQRVSRCVSTPMTASTESAKTLHDETPWKNRRCSTPRPRWITRGRTLMSHADRRTSRFIKPTGEQAGL
jgi:hypothetical protein